MHYAVLWVALIFLLTSCSQKQLVSLMANTPDLAYDKAQTKGLNKYQKDAVYLTEAIKQAYPRLEDKLSNEAFDTEKRLLLQDLSHITNDQDFEIRLQAFVALLKDGHSLVQADYFTPEAGIFPLRIYKEKEDWVLMNTDRTMADSTLIGSRIISVNQVPVSEIEARIRKLESSENEYWINIISPPHLQHPSYWKAIGIIKTYEDGLDMIVLKDNVEKSFTLYPIKNAIGYNLTAKEPVYPFTKQQNEGFYSMIDKDADYAYLQMNTCLDYVSIKSEIASYTNFFTRPIALLYLKKQKKDAMDFGKTLQSLFKEIDEKKIDHLIIDLRYNTGGDERLGKQLIWYLSEEKTIEGFTMHVKVSDFFRQTVKQDYKKYDKLYREKHGAAIPNREINLNKEVFGQTYFEDITQKGSPYLLDASIPKFKGKVYLLVGNQTFSAAQWLATTIADNRLAILVGRPIGNKPTAQSGHSQFKLPHTKKIVNLSYMYTERPNKSKNEERTLFPDIELNASFQDVMDGKDVVFEYIMNEIDQEEGHKTP